MDISVRSNSSTHVLQYGYNCKIKLVINHPDTAEWTPVGGEQITHLIITHDTTQQTIHDYHT